MSAAERERVFVVRANIDGALLQHEGAERLGICLRQMKRLVWSWSKLGDQGLVLRQRRRVSPRRLVAEAELKIVALLRGAYAGFGPTLAAEKLCERDQVTISRESLWSCHGVVPHPVLV